MRRRGIEEEALDDANLRGLLGQVDVLGSVSLSVMRDLAIDCSRTVYVCWAVQVYAQDAPG